jgi:hypothetical protein
VEKHDDLAKLAGMTKELSGLVRHSKHFPYPDAISDPRIRSAVLAFAKRHKPSRRFRFTSKDALEFVRRWDIFGIFARQLSGFSRKGKLCIIIEGADATGKTTLVKYLGRELGARCFENKSQYFFKRMFNMSKIYKTAAIDYNGNPLIGMIFYFVSNLLVLRRASASHDRITIIDSSMIRTIASHVAQPDFSTGNKTGWDHDKSHYGLCLKLNSMAINALARAGSVLVVFLYADEAARSEQAGSRRYMDAYDTSPNYATAVSNFLKKSEVRLREKNVRTVSILTGGKSVHTSGWKPDYLIPKTNDRKKDISKKVGAITKLVG